MVTIQKVPHKGTALGPEWSSESQLCFPPQLCGALAGQPWVGHLNCPTFKFCKHCMEAGVRRG